MWWISLVSLAAEPVLPSLLETSPPVYPPGELARGLAASVLLDIDVSDEGLVLSVRINTSAGPAFDAAAVQAARNYRFTPARDSDGRAVPATITYRVTFEPSAAPVLSVTGQVRSAGTRQLLEGVDVLLESEERSVVAVTDGDGAFFVAGLSDGTWTVTTQASGYRDEQVSIIISSGNVTNVRLFPVEDRPWENLENGVSEEITVVGRRVAPEVTERTLSQEELRYMPGTAGDIVRVVQNLPGVARPPLGIGQLVIRGTAPEDSAYYIDGAPIPNVFHFAGFSTVLVSDTIAEIGFLPGNYGVRYGRTLGGVVDLRTGSALPERSRGYVSVDLFQTTLFAQQRFGRSAITVAGRRSYIDAVLNPVLNSTGASQIRAPRYYDFQARVFGETRRGGTIDALLLASDDEFRVLGTNADDEEEVTFGLSSNFQKLRLLSIEPLGRWRNEASLIMGPENQEFAFGGDGLAYERPFSLSVRDELLRAAETSGISWGLRLGIDALVGTFRYSYALPGFGEPEGADAVRFYPALYVEPTARLGPLELIAGARGDLATLGAVATLTSFDPRLAGRLDLSSSTILEASAGGYSQFPTVRQIIDEPLLGPQRSWQLSVGLEQRLGPKLSAELTGFNNYLSQLVSGREDAFRFFSGPPPVGPLDTAPYDNVGTGRIYGLEALVRLSTERTAAWLSLTASRSTRIDRPDQPSELFEYDQPLVLTVLGSHELPKRWRLGARVRLSSGNAYTPVANRFLDLSSRTYIPVYSAEVDGERLPTFGSLDLRVDKDWVYRNWTLTLYLDLQNATNRQNVEVMAWSDDYRTEEPINGLPLVPAFGVRGEW